MQPTIKRIRSASARIGMELANDVFSPTGSVIANKGERLNVRLLHMIRMHNIEYLYIIVGEKINPEEYLNIERQSMIQFSEAYKATESEVKKSMQGICQGEKVEAHCFFEITDKVMHSLEKPEEILKYLYALRADRSTTFTHSLNVSIVSNLIGTWLHYGPAQIKELTIAALLHDIGKTIRSYHPEQDYHFHPLIGHDLLQKHNYPASIANAVLFHHETLDGTGFPMKIKWGEIPEYARIIAIANFYDNQTTGGKTYQERPHPYKVLQLLERDGFTRFDSTYMNTFMKRIAHYYQNAWVRLSDGRKGKIVFINEYALSSPIVDIAGELVNLYSRKDITIDRIL
ncbi:HD-GYP domain-containing protein [Heliorestis convoluta]|uniref:HD domain-containing protein n=1 Tax=Heliorestis convoluta TaxID=356322 RepID=A0A5Q2MZW5_9FIRM|nr:HD domain-containing phosphohydrolase [Heliorestis convoluta]QGG47601.1 HD domain-containing protein [Heliorestis convoluta]